MTADSNTNSASHDAYGHSSNGAANGSYVNGSYANGNHANGNQANGKHSTSNLSRLRPAEPDEVQDLICVGFGPASLAVAVAVHDALEAGTLKTAPKILFLEKQHRFAWHAGMLLPGAKMQISFIKDLAMLRNPRSAFTFTNYLHENGRLVEFTNLGTFLPARAEYEDYLRWCASSFGESVVYNSEVLSVSSDIKQEQQQNGEAAVSRFSVTAKNVATGAEHVYRARNVLMATGGKPSLPACLPASHPRVIHSSQYAHLVPTILNNRQAPYRVAVVGAGQSAAEIFNNIQELYPNSQTYLVMRSEFLKPSDDSPFVNSIFNPEYIDSLYPKPASYRKNLLADARPTNYGVVRLELIEELYDRMYHQRRTLGTDEKKWPHRILASSRIARVESGDKNVLRLIVEPDQGYGASGEVSSKAEALDVDLIVGATGYQRNAHLTMLEGLWPLLPEKTAATSAEAGSGIWEVNDATAANGSAAKVLSVARDYHVNFAPGRVAQGSGVWLQGCCEGTHGLSDTLLSVLATRSGEIVESIFGDKKSI
ncbi:PAK-related GC kinase Sid1 [Sporothrix curviconia]|uniref:L-ornithine N(5)-monooxygenase [NAD(P)H] n=1 Tax=Sporothrix curviconia TaxID=1260050 RepID=A0ABP0ARZ6_9PEZI